MKNRSIILVLVLSIALALLSPVFGDANVFEVRGYREGIRIEDYTELPVNFTVSNVVGDFNKDKIARVLDAGLTVTMGAEIQVATDSVFMFDVYPLHEESPELYMYYYEESIVGEGNLLVAIYNEENEEYVMEEMTVEAFLALEDETAEVYGYGKGYTVTLNVPGLYYVLYRHEAIAGSASAFIEVVEDDQASEMQTRYSHKETVEMPESVDAIPTSATVMVDGQEVSFEAYTIAGNNYFKLRDLAMAIKDTEESFEVLWSSEHKAISILSYSEYTVAGGELTLGDNKEKIGKYNNSPIFFDYYAVELDAYTIDGNNYFKLRDIAELLNIGVTWNNATKTIGIETALPYTE